MYRLGVIPFLHEGNKKTPENRQKISQDCGSKSIALLQGLHDRELKNRSPLTSAKTGMFVTVIKNPTSLGWWGEFPIPIVVMKKPVHSNRRATRSIVHAKHENTLVSALHAAFCVLLTNEHACKIHIEQKDAPHWYADLLEFHSVPAS